MTDLTINPPRGGFRAEAGVPGDKSLSHRALILAAHAGLADRQVVVRASAGSFHLIAGLRPSRISFLVYSRHLGVE